MAGTGQVKIRQSDFSTFTRQRSLRPPSNGTEQLFEAAKGLLADWLIDYPGARIRLLGVGGSHLVRDSQPDLFDAPQESAAHLDSAADEVRERFGNASLSRARTLDPGEIR